MSSAWIGERHFDSLGVLSCPDIVLAYVAANTTRVRRSSSHHPAATHRAFSKRVLSRHASRTL
jgi:alkanesulfonate monooxygenase SsuD/methylene tetrahydromethanopterin reductase-like flavin-dependent oxidoreductase (luciferase family)